MQSTERNDIFLQTLATILIRSFLFGLAFLLLWFVLCLIAPGWMFDTNAKWFNIGKRDFDLINYFGIGFVKISILLFFLFPLSGYKIDVAKKRKKITCAINVSPFSLSPKARGDDLYPLHVPCHTF